MKKENQSLLDFLGNTPLGSFMVQRSPISNKEAQALYNIWQDGNKDEYGKHLIDDKIDPIQIASLNSKGYIRNVPMRFGSRQRLLEFTGKGKEVIKKIILHHEKSAFEKESKNVNYEAICRKAAMQELLSDQKIASKQSLTQNWLTRST